MATWGICTLTANSADQVLAFVAHHLALGPDRIHLFFDNPADPAIDRVQGIDRVSVTVCDEAHWKQGGRTRPKTHQDRQRRNLEQVWRDSALDWILHIDIDEFLLPARPVFALLDRAAPDQPTVKAAPFEALSDPSLPDDIFTARLFRGVLSDPGMRKAQFGRFAEVMDHGSLAHKWGKAFFRTGVRGLRPAIHHAVIDGVEVKDGPFHPDLKLLHFHAADQAAWVASAHRRAASGAYRFRKPLRELLLGLDSKGLLAFHAAIHRPDAAQLRLLHDGGLIVETELRLREKVAALAR